MACEMKQGCTRNVFLIGNLAIKIPRFVEWKHFLKGLLANLQEVRYNNNPYPELCPVVFHIAGGFLLVMQRAEPITRQMFFDMEINVFSGFPVEHKQDSYGLLNDRIVAVDYGLVT